MEPVTSWYKSLACIGLSPDLRIGCVRHSPASLPIQAKELAEVRGRKAVCTQELATTEDCG